MLTNATVLCTRKRLIGAVRVKDLHGTTSFVDYRDGFLRWFDSYGTETDRRPLHLPGPARVLAADTAGSVALSTSDGLFNSTRAGLLRTGLQADAAAFLGDAVVVAASREDSHIVALIDPTTGAIAARRLIHVRDAAGVFVPHPTDALVFLELGRGQDGGTLHCVKGNDAATFEVTALPVAEDEVIADVHPRGDRLLVVNSQGRSFPRVLAWPGLRERGRFDVESIELALGLADIGCWVDEDHIALYATEDSLILTDQSLERPRRVDLPISFGDTADIEGLLKLTDREVDIEVWTPEARSTVTVRFA